MLQFMDRAPIEGTKRTEDGYLTTVARSVRTGVQIYAGREVGRPDLLTVRVMRPADEVHSADSLQSFSHAPVTMNHPSEAVTADNWAALAVGEVSTAAKVDSDGWVSLPLILKDAAAIAAVESGKRELSAGYTCELEWTDGHPDHDAIQRNIRINHLAIVDRARAGAKARIGDHWGASPVHATDTENLSMTLKTVLVDGLQVETTEAGAQAIAKLMADAARVADGHAAALAAKDTALATADAKLAKAEAERDAALAKVLDGAALDAAVAARGDLIAKAKALAPKVVTDGKSDLEIRRSVLTERGIALDGKSEAYIDARFDTLVEDLDGSNKVADSFTKIKPTTDAAAEEAAALAKANDFNSWRDE